MRNTSRLTRGLALATVATLLVAVPIARGLAPLRSSSTPRPAPARALAPTSPPTPRARATDATDRLIVRVRPGSSPTAIAALAHRMGGVARGRVSRLGVVVFAVPGRIGVKAALARLAHAPAVVSAEPDYRVHVLFTPNDTYYARQWALPAVSAPKAWDYTKGSTNTVVAVVDSGVAAHPELAGRLVAGHDFVNADSNPADDNGHGTAVAGVIGATGNNGTGIAGMDWATRIMPVKVVDASGSGYTSDIAKGVIWAADHGARVINMSLGGNDYSSTLKSAIAYAYNKGAVLVASAGNDGSTAAMYPAAYPYVLSVSALHGSTLADFSSYGPNTDLAAPGESVYSLTRTGGYSYWSGTSFSAPMVSGLAALVLGRNPTLSAARVTQVLTSTADDLGTSGWDQKYGWGRIDAGRALAAAGLPADKTPPHISIATPVSGAPVWSRVPLRAIAHDDRGVRKVVFSVDGDVCGTDTSSAYEVPLATSKLAPGWHYITATAYDAANNAGASGHVWVRVTDAR